MSLEPLLSMWNMLTGCIWPEVLKRRLCLWVEARYPAHQSFVHIYTDVHILASTRFRWLFASTSQAGDCWVVDGFQCCNLWSYFRCHCRYSGSLPKAWVHWKIRAAWAVCKFWSNLIWTQDLHWLNLINYIFFWDSNTGIILTICTIMLG